MSAPLNQLTQARRATEALLLQRAALDPAFRDLLAADPHAALGQVFGTDPVPDMRLRVLVETPGEVILVLPQPLNQDELPDSLLDLAVGGAGNKVCKGDGATLQEREYLGHGLDS